MTSDYTTVVKLYKWFYNCKIKIHISKHNVWTVT